MNTLPVTPAAPASPGGLTAGGVPDGFAEAIAATLLAQPAPTVAPTMGASPNPSVVAPRSTTAPSLPSIVSRVVGAPVGSASVAPGATDGVASSVTHPAATHPTPATHPAATHPAALPATHPAALPATHPAALPATHPAAPGTVVASAPASSSTAPRAATEPSPDTPVDTMVPAPGPQLALGEAVVRKTAEGSDPADDRTSPAPATPPIVAPATTAPVSVVATPVGSATVEIVTGRSLAPAPERAEDAEPVVTELGASTATRPVDTAPTPPQTRIEGPSPEMIRRVEETIQRLEQGPPPRAIVLDLAELGGSRITVAVTPDGIRLSVPEGSTTPPRLIAELEQALSAGGFDLADHRGGRRPQEEDPRGWRPQPATTRNDRSGIRL